MVIKLPPMNIVSDNERLIPVIRRSKVGRPYPQLVNNPKYDKCKDDLILIIKPQIPDDWKPSKNVVWEIFARTYKDVTNILKILGDALEGAGVVSDDKYIGTVFVVKYFEDRKGPDEVHMRIVNLEDDDGG